MTKQRRPGSKQRRAPDELSTRAPGRFLRRLVVATLLLLGVVLVTPTIVALSPLRDTILSWQIPPGGWHVRSQTGSFSWFGGQSLQSVEITDPEGKPLCTVDSVSVGRSLLQLALQPRDLGLLKVVRPVVHLTTDAQGSNWENFRDACLAHRKPEQSTASTNKKTPLTLDVEIVDGTLHGFDESSQRAWTVQHTNLNLSQPGDLQRLAADGSADVTYSPQQSSGRVKFRIQHTPEGQQQLDLLAEGLQLNPLASWLGRILGECNLTGIASLEAHSTFSGSAQQLTLQTWGSATIRNLTGTGQILNGDQLQCQTLEIPWRLRIANGELLVEDLHLQSEWGQLTAQGSLAIADLNAKTLVSFPQREFSLTGQVSLAELSRMLPNTLQIRSGVGIEAGDLQVTARAERTEQGFIWLAKASLENLAGQDHGRQIRSQQPIQLTVQCAASPTGPRLETLSVESSFARAEFSTSQNRTQGNFQINLEQLTQELGQFIDWQQLALRGSATGNVLVNLTAQQDFDANAQINLQDFALKTNGRLLWEESQLGVNFDVAGKAEELRPARFIDGKIALRGEHDSLDIELLTPVNLKAVDSWPLHVSGRGPLQSWAGRLRPWLASIPDDLSGEAALAGKLVLRRDGIEVRDVVGSVERLRVHNGTIELDDPHVEFSGDASWDHREGSLKSRELQIAGSILAMRSRDIRFELGAVTPIMTGDVAFRTDLERLASAAGLVNRTERIWPRGAASGVVRFATNSQQVLADISFDADGLQLMRSPATQSSSKVAPTAVWSEPRLHAAGKAVYTIDKQRVEVENLQIDGQTVQVAGDAFWDHPQSNGPLEISGMLQYEPASLAMLISNYVGPEVNVQGDRVVRFRARWESPTPSDHSTHWSQSLVFSSESGWTKASVFGLPISSGKVEATLQQGQLRIAPLDLAVGQGRLILHPLVRFDPSPSQVLLPAGPLISDVQVSPEVSEKMLKYVAPVLAGATRVDGEFSVELAASQIPLAQPRASQMEGTLSVHQLNVMPGPLVAGLVSTVRQLQSLKDGKDLLQNAVAPPPPKLLSMQDQRIEFKVLDGRVYHRNLVFNVDDVQVSSQGSVGFDQTLALVVDIPIQDRWIQNEEALSSLAGQSVQIPIQGTFAQPQVDQRAVADLSRKLIRQTARQAISNEINRQLEKLFKNK